MGESLRITFDKTETLADGCCGTSVVGRYHTNYVLRVHREMQTWVVHKRYSDFRALDAQLRTKFW